MNTEELKAYLKQAAEMERVVMGLEQLRDTQKLYRDAYEHLGNPQEYEYLYSDDHVTKYPYSKSAFYDKKAYPALQKQNEKAILPLWNKVFENADQKLEQLIKQRRPQKPKLQTPVMPGEVVQVPPNEVTFREVAVSAAFCVVPFAFLALVLLSKYALAVLVLSAIIYILVFMKIKNHLETYLWGLKSKYSVYQSAKELYDKQTKCNQQRITEYENACNQADRDVLHEHTAFMKEGAEAISTSLTENEAQLEEAQATLEQLYAMNILHPKYRNFIAVTMLLEYFETERCDSLTGVNGAYNLYETELRQNLIILKLDEIVEHLDNLQATMYNCCAALTTLNQQMNQVQKQLGSISVTTDQQLAVQQQTMQLSAATAMYSAATAANTEALKYITLVS